MVKRSNIAQAVPALAHNYWPGQVTGQSALGNCDQVLHIPCIFPALPAYSLHAATAVLMEVLMMHPTSGGKPQE